MTYKLSKNNREVLEHAVLEFELEVWHASQLGKVNTVAEARDKLISVFESIISIDAKEARLELAQMYEITGTASLRQFRDAWIKLTANIRSVGEMVDALHKQIGR